MNRGPNIDAPGPSTNVPRKKKITRLIPAEESLAAIEECTERSEDSSIIQEIPASEMQSPMRSCKTGIAKLATETIDEDYNANPLQAHNSGSSHSSTGNNGTHIVPLNHVPIGMPVMPPLSSSTPKSKPPPQPLVRKGVVSDMTKDLQASARETIARGGHLPPALSQQQPEQAPPIRSHQHRHNQHPSQPQQSQQQQPQQQSPSSTGSSGSSSNRQPQHATSSPNASVAPQRKSSPIPPSSSSAGESSVPNQQAHQHTSLSPKAATAAAAAGGRSGGTSPTAPGNGSNNGGGKKADEGSNEDTVATEKMTEGEDDEDGDSIQHNDASNQNDSRGSLLGASAGSLQDSVQGDDVNGEHEMFDFDDDYDDEMDHDEKEEVLTWRLDPSVSLSDWTIIVRTREDPGGRHDTYHVHKNMMAVGPRKSEYFVNVFRMVAQRPPGDPTAVNVTEVELGKAAAKVFPIFLDFLYSPNEKALDLSTTSATGLRHLAQFFGVRVLHKRVMDFIQKDLSLATATVYYRDVCALRDEKLLLTIAKFCSRNIMKIEPNFSLVETMDSFFLAKLMSSPHVNTKEKKYHCSLLLAEYCQKNKDLLDDKQFLMLSDEKVLPLVHHSVALTLLETEADLVVATSLSSLMEMTSLQKRCIKELSHHWRELCDMETEQISRVCRKLPSSVVTDLLIKSLSQAKKKLQQQAESTEGIDSSKHKNKTKKGGPPGSGSDSAGGASVGKSGAPLGKPPIDAAAVLAKREYEIKLEKLRQEHTDELIQLKKEYENNLVRLRDMLVEKDKTISKFWHEIKSFERLPNGHDGKLVPSGRNHEATYVPELSRTAPDGILLVSKKSGPKFPVFYYKKDDRSASESNSTADRSTR